MRKVSKRLCPRCYGAGGFHASHCDLFTKVKPRQGPVVLTAEEWRLIGASLETAYYMFDLATLRLDRIVIKIGKDGQLAAARGVAPAGGKRK